MSKQTLQDAAAREQIRTRLDVNLLVEAGAGSGKTESLAGRMVALIATGLGTVEQIAAVTFTKKAAAELRGRFRIELERRMGVESDPSTVERLHEAMSSMERMFAGTIHSFCAKLLRERPVEAGLAPGFREIEEAEDAVLRRAAWREFIDHAQKEQSPELAALLDAEIRLADLHDAFTSVCQYPDVGFPPGDGAPPDAPAAWREMDRFWQRLRSMCPSIDANSTCKIQEVMVEFESRYRNASRRRMAMLASMLGMWESERKVVQKWWPGNGKEAAAFVDEFRAATAVPFLLAWRHYLYRLAMTLLAGARDFAAAERRRGALLNFTDLLLLACHLVRDNLVVRAALQSKYRFLFVDEFQDTDPLQLELLFLLAAEPGTGTDWTVAQLRPGALFLVGDPKQSIFRFRRADIELYQQAKRRVEQTCGLVVHLTSCFRSGPALCDWLNQVFTTSPLQPATVWQPAFERLDAGRADAAASLGAVRLLIPADFEQRQVPEEDARAIAAYIRAEVDAQRRGFGDFLVLTRRKRNRLGPITEALEQARVPYEVSGSGSLMESAYVQALVTLLHSLTHPDDGISLVGVLRGHCFGFSDPELYRYRKSGGVFRLSVPVDQGLSGEIADALRELQEWRGLLRRLPAGAAIETILERSGLLARASAASTGGGEAGKLLFAQDCLRASCDAGMTLGDSIAALEEAQESDESDAPVLEPGRRDVVRVMNLHKAKGLEAKVVFLADPLAGVGPRANIRIVREDAAARGYLAITRPKGEYHREMLAHPAGWAQHQEEELRFVEGEERRLLYVASTRACETLVVSEWLGRPRSVTQPWAPLKPSLEGRPSLPLLASPVETVPLLPDVSAAARDAATASRTARREQMQALAFRGVAISGMAAHAAPSLVVRAGGEGPAGRDWGSLIHALLEYNVVNFECSRGDLDAVARWQTAGSALLQADISSALDVIERIRASAMWDRVRQAEERHPEVPLAARLDGDPVLLARGIIDLALKYPEGWHIVDYKTDVAPVAQLVEMYGEQVRAYATLWQKITGERVVFAGLYSVRDLELTCDVRDAVRGA